MIAVLRQLLAAFLSVALIIPTNAWPKTIAGDPNNINGAVSYVYDPVGNRTQKTSTLPGYPGGLSNYNANDQLTIDTYDADGNTVGSGSNTGANGYVYDFENRLIQQGGISIVYDGDGNRVKKTVAGITTTYLVDDLNPTGYAQVVNESFSGGSGGNLETTHNYIYGLERVLELRQHTVNFTNVTNPIYYVYDGHGSVRALTDSTGTVTDTYDYDAFGNLIHSTGTTPNNYLFAGEQFDPDLNLYYNRARYLNTSTGRFWSMDSYEGDSESPSSLHKYIYTGSDPVNRFDPSGHEFDLATTTAVSGIIGTLSGAIVGGITGGTRGAIRGAVEGAIFGIVFPLGGAGIGAAVLGNAARGVFLVGLGGLIGSTGVSVYSVATAQNSNERNGAIASLVLSAAFVAIGPRVLQTASTRTFQAEQINSTFPPDYKPPYAPATVVTETTIFKPATLVRVYSEGNTNPVGAWLADPSDVNGFSPDDVQSFFSLPFKPTHVETVNVPAGTTMRIGFANPDAFGGVGYGLQYQLMNGIPPGAYGPGALF